MARKLAAIMAGDVVGYSRLMAEDEDGTYGSLRPASRRSWGRRRSHGGRVFKTTGDGFLAASAARATRSPRRRRSRTASPTAAEAAHRHQLGT
jgi:class 3 adenylate cyclase